MKKEKAGNDFRENKKISLHEQANISSLFRVIYEVYEICMFWSGIKNNSQYKD